MIRTSTAKVLWTNSGHFHAAILRTCQHHWKQWTDYLHISPELYSSSSETMAGLFHLIRQQEISGKILFWHTGGQPALFGYGDALLD